MSWKGHNVMQFHFCTVLSSTSFLDVLRNICSPRSQAHLNLSGTAVQRCIITSTHSFYTYCSLSMPPTTCISNMYSSSDCPMIPGTICKTTSIVIHSQIQDIWRCITYCTRQSIVANLNVCKNYHIPQN